MFAIDLRLKTWSLLLLLPIIGSCGGGSSSARVSPAPTIEYAKTVSAGAGTMADYMDADWIYQNYLGEYGLPAEVKQYFLPELQMLANGFALQFKRGDDVKTSVAQFHQGVMMMHANGEMAQFFAQVNQDPVQFIKSVTGQDNALRPPSADSQYPAPILNANELAAIEKARLHAEQKAAEWERVRKEYDLPYALPERVEKWFIYSPAMKGKGSTPVPAPIMHNLSQWTWVHGDFVYFDGGSLNPFGHVALMDMWVVPGTAIEAQTDSGVQRVFTNRIEPWANQYHYAEGHRMRLYWSPVMQSNWSQLCNPFTGTCTTSWYWGYPPETKQRMGAVTHAANRIGQKYNWMFLNKTSSTSTYCSQLVWQAYYQQGIDLDFDQGPAVFPRDLTRSPMSYVFNVN